MLPFDTRRVPRYLYVFPLLLILAAAAYVRFRHLGDRSLWLDEAWVANAISKGSWHSLLESSLTAPLFFVISIHFIVSLFGNNEFFLRLLPCLFGLGTLVIFYLLLRRHAGKTAVLVSTLGLAFSYNFIHYSQELKQYTAAMFFSTLLIFYCEKVILHDKSWSWALLLALSILGIGFDHSVVFTIPAVFVVLLLSFPVKKHWKIISLYGFCVFAFIILYYFLHIRAQLSQILGAIQGYWIPYYPKFTSFSVFFDWLLDSIKNIFDFYSLPYFPLSLIIIISGLTLFHLRSQKRFLAYILIPPVLVLGASILKRYPFGGTRLMLFYAPLLFLPFGKGLDFIFNKMKRGRLYLPLLMVVFFLSVSPIADFVKMVKNPLKREELRPVIAEIQSSIEPADKIYVYYGAVDAFRYYYKTKFYRMVETKNIIWGESHRDNIQRYEADLKKILRKDMRIWIVFSHYWENERAGIVEYLNLRGKLIKTIAHVGAMSYFFEIETDS